MPNVRTDSRSASRAAAPAPDSSNSPAMIMSWILVGAPLAWGVYNTIVNATKLFH